MEDDRLYVRTLVQPRGESTQHGCQVGLSGHHHTSLAYILDRFATGRSHTWNRLTLMRIEQRSAG